MTFPSFLLGFSLMLMACSPTPKTTDTVFMEDLTSVELSQKIKAGYTTVLLYSGGTEATGPQIVLGKHNYKGKAYAQRVASELGNTLVAPVLPFAPNWETLKAFPGTISLDSLTFSQVNEQVAQSLIATGFTHVILMCDHYDSQAPLQALAQKMSAEGLADVYYAGDGYAKARTAIEQSITARDIVAGGHGGHWDVSEAMAISDTLVRRETFSLGDTVMGGNAQLDVRGVSGDPRQANVKDGQTYADLRVKLYVAEIRKHLKAGGTH